MDEHKEDKLLDELLKKAVDSGKVEFDAEKWKQEHPSAWQAIVSRKVVATSKEWLPRVFRYRKLGWVAAAAVIIIGIAIAVVHQKPTKQVNVPSVVSRVKTPAEMMSMLSLTMAYRRGGMEAVDEQCDKALKMLGSKATSISINELLNETNGKEPKRKEL